MANFKEYAEVDTNVRFRKPIKLGSRTENKSIELTGKREVVEKNYI